MCYYSTIGKGLKEKARVLKYIVPSVINRAVMQHKHGGPVLLYQQHLYDTAELTLERIDKSTAAWYMKGQCKE